MTFISHNISVTYDVAVSRISQFPLHFHKFVKKNGKCFVKVETYFCK